MIETRNRLKNLSQLEYREPIDESSKIWGMIRESIKKAAKANVVVKKDMRSKP